MLYEYTHATVNEPQLVAMGENMRPLLLAISAIALFFAGPLHSASIMPAFDNTLPAGWDIDRYDPDFFGYAGPFQGRNNVLEIRIDESDNQANRPPGFSSSFYNTQGRQYGIDHTTAGAGSILSADLWIPSSWSDELTYGTRRTDMWGIMTDGSSVVDYPIIGFTNEGNTPRFRIWDATSWVDLLVLPVYDTWNSFAMLFTGTSFEYYVNQQLVYIDQTTAGALGYQGIIMQGSVYDQGRGNYQIYWSNSLPQNDQVPEPGTITLMLIGLGMLLGRRKLRGV